MTLADRGRFCGECKKVVRELAQVTEAEARALLASPPTEGLCVRYVHDATGEIVFRPDVVPVTRLARVRRAAAVALAAASLPLAVAGCMGAAPMPPPQVPTAPTVDPSTMGVVVMGEPPAMPTPPVEPPPTTPVLPVPRCGPACRGDRQRHPAGQMRLGGAARFTANSARSSGGAAAAEECFSPMPFVLPLGHHPSWHTRCSAPASGERHTVPCVAFRRRDRSRRREL